MPPTIVGVVGQTVPMSTVAMTASLLTDRVKTRQLYVPTDVMLMGLQNTIDT